MAWRSVFNTHSRQAGFTLVEIIAVIVILALVSVVGSSFLVQTVDTYRDTKIHSQIFQRGRITIEQMTRQLRMATPNSIRVSLTGNCIEFMPVVGGAYYRNQLPDQANAKAASNVISTSPFYLGLGSAEYVVVAPFFPSEIYTNASPSARADIANLPSTPSSSINLSSGHRFVRNSPQQRVFITDNPSRFCLSANNMVIYENYGLLTNSMSDANPGGETILLAENVATNSQAFDLSPGSEDRNSIVLIDLVFSQGGRSIALNHEVLIKNVP